MKDPTGQQLAENPDHWEKQRKILQLLSQLQSLQDLIKARTAIILVQSRILSEVDPSNSPLNPALKNIEEVMEKAKEEISRQIKELKGLKVSLAHSDAGAVNDAFAMTISDFTVRDNIVYLTWGSLNSHVKDIKRLTLID
jgi:hypothetical protein